MVRPTLPLLSVAPITATLCGANMESSVRLPEPKTSSAGSVVGFLESFIKIFGAETLAFRRREECRLLSS